jgi:hypothetical protein
MIDLEKIIKKNRIRAKKFKKLYKKSALVYPFCKKCGTVVVHILRNLLRKKGVWEHASCDGKSWRFLAFDKKKFKKLEEKENG